MRTMNPTSGQGLNTVSALGVAERGGAGRIADVISRARSQSLGDVLRRTAARAPQKLAVVDGVAQFTYAELDRVVNRTANALTLRGITQGDRVAMVSRNCWEYVVLSFALARVGAILVLPNFRLGPGEVAWIVQHSSARAFVCEDEFYLTARGVLECAGVEIRVLGWISRTDAAPPAAWETFSARAQHHDDCASGAVVAGDAPLRLMYRSGTESRPKGVMHSSRTLIAQCVSCIIDGGMSSDDINVIAAPLYHCARSIVF
jgi:fatty-acyl-CoA synthase